MAAQPLKLVEAGSLRPLLLQKIDIEVQCDAFLSQTKVTMVWLNPADTKFEAELSFPLPEGGAVCGYAVDVDNKLVPGVIVSKEKARATFEAEVRKDRGGPALIEQSVGNIFNTRINPFLPHGTRTIQVTFSQDLAQILTSGSRMVNTYILPFLTPASSRCPATLQVSIPAKFLPSISPGHGFIEDVTDKEATWRKTKDHQIGAFFHTLSGRCNDWSISSPLSISLEAPSVDSTIVCEHCDQDTLSLSAVIKDIPNGSGASSSTSSWSTSKIGLLWDASKSRDVSVEDRQMEINALEALLRDLDNRSERFELDLFTFNIRPSESPVRFESKSMSQVANTLRQSNGITYHGGTDYNALNKLVNPAASVLGGLFATYKFWIVVTDGISTFGGQDLPDLQAPVYILSAATTGDHAFLRRWARRSNGKFFNLRQSVPADIIKGFSDTSMSFLFATLGNVQLVTEATPLDDSLAVLPLKSRICAVPSTPKSIDASSLRFNARINIKDSKIAQLLTSGDSKLPLTLHFGIMSTAQVLHKHSFYIDITQVLDQGVPTKPLVALSERAWAQARLSELQEQMDLLGKSTESTEKTLLEQEQLALSRHFTLVTPNTSLIVLETLQQFLDHMICPPTALPEIYKEYQQRIAVRVREEEGRKAEKTARVHSWWQRRQKWSDVNELIRQQPHQDAQTGITDYDIAFRTHGISEQDYKANRQILHLFEYGTEEMNNLPVSSVDIHNQPWHFASPDSKRWPHFASPHASARSRTNPSTDSTWDSFFPLRVANGVDNSPLINYAIHLIAHGPDTGATEPEPQQKFGKRTVTKARQNNYSQKPILDGRYRESPVGHTSDDNLSRFIHSIPSDSSCSPASLELEADECASPTSVSLFDEEEDADIGLDFFATPSPQTLSQQGDAASSVLPASRKRSSVVADAILPKIEKDSGKKKKKKSKKEMERPAQRYADSVNFDAEFVSPNIDELVTTCEEEHFVFEGFTYTPTVSADAAPAILPDLNQPTRTEFSPEAPLATIDRPLSRTSSRSKHSRAQQQLLPQKPQGALAASPPPPSFAAPPSIPKPPPSIGREPSAPAFNGPVLPTLGGKQLSQSPVTKNLAHHVSEDESRNKMSADSKIKSVKDAASKRDDSGPGMVSGADAFAVYSRPSCAPSSSSTTLSGGVLQPTSSEKRLSNVFKEVSEVEQLAREIGSMVQEQSMSLDNINENVSYSYNTATVDTRGLQQAAPYKRGLVQGLAGVGSAVGGFFSGLTQLAKKSEPSPLDSIVLQDEDTAPSAPPTIGFNSYPASGERYRSLAPSSSSTYYEEAPSYGALGTAQSPLGGEGGGGGGRNRRVKATESNWQMRASDSSGIETERDYDRISAVNSQIDDVKEILAQNISSVLSRGERLESLQDLSSDLDAQSFQFKSSARTLKRRMWRRNTMLLLLLIGLPLFALYGICWFFDLSLLSASWNTLITLAPLAIMFALIVPVDIIDLLKFHETTNAFLLIWAFPFAYAQAIYHTLTSTTGSWTRDLSYFGWLLLFGVPLFSILKNFRDMSKQERLIVPCILVAANLAALGLFYGANYFGYAFSTMLLLPPVASFIFAYVALSSVYIRNGAMAKATIGCVAGLLLGGAHLLAGYFSFSIWYLLVGVVVSVTVFLSTVAIYARSNGIQREKLRHAALGFGHAALQIFALIHFGAHYSWPSWLPYVIGIFPALLAIAMIVASRDVRVFATIDTFALDLILLSYWAGDYFIGFPFLTMVIRLYLVVSFLILRIAPKKKRALVLIAAIPVSCGAIYGIYLLFLFALPYITWTTAAFCAVLALLSWVATFTKTSLPYDASIDSLSLDQGYQQSRVSRPYLVGEVPLILEVPVQDGTNVPAFAVPNTSETSDLSSIPASNTVMMNQYDLIQYERPRFAYISSTPDGSDKRVVSSSVDWKFPSVLPMSAESAKYEYDSLSRAGWTSDGTTHLSTMFKIGAALLPTDSTLAMTALSNLAEGHLGKVQLLRSAAYKLEEAGHLEDAANLYRRILALRGEEPQSYRDLALVLSQLQKYEECFSLFDTVLTRCKPDWDARFSQVEIVALMDLCGILPHLNQMDCINTGLNIPNSIIPVTANPVQVDLRAVLTWDVDGLDVELQVLEPEGEVLTSFTNQSSRGGMLSRDFSGGYGPVEYLSKRCAPGQYCLRAKIRSPCAKPILGGEATLRLVIFTNYGTPKLQTQVTKIFRIVPSGGMVVNLASVAVKEEQMK